MKKYASMICLLLSLLCILPLNAYAAESKDTTLKYDVGSNYTLTIPDYIEANTDGQPISISDAVIPADYEINVTAGFDGLLKLQNHPNITLSYTLFANGNEVTDGESVLKKHSGETSDSSAVISAQVKGTPIYSGTYLATVTFTADLKEVTQTNYTVEEIENDPHLFGIGQTKPEYVVARFNDDYSNAIVTKNGNDSDGSMRGFTTRQSPFSLNKKTLSTVVVKDGVTSIGQSAFYECSNLSKAVLPDGMNRINKEAFYKCISLDEIYLSDDITKIGDHAFYNCKSLTSVKLPSNLERIESSTFSDCTSLNTVEMGNKITDIGGNAFMYCALKDITLSSSLQSIGYWAFRSCKSLESIIIPESVTSIGSDCFRDCDNLRNVRLPEKITKIESSTFSNCKLLEEINIPSGITLVDAWGFSGCRSIKYMHLPESLYNINNYAFSNMNSVEYFDISPNNPYFCTVDGVMFSKDMSKLYYFPLGKNVTKYFIPDSVTTLGTSSFGRCKTLTDIYVPATVTTVESTMFGNANHPMIHTPTGSAMEQYCIENKIQYDNIMQ